MATSTFTTKTIKSVTLELTEEEASVLVAALASVGGSPTKSPRGILDGIRMALQTSVGHYADQPSRKLVDSGCIMFRDYGSSTPATRPF